MNRWKNVRTFQFAISDREGETMLNIPKMGQRGATFANRDNIAERIRVRTLPLDSFPELKRADVIKIDVEGAEVKVLRGMERIMERGKAKIICEVHPKQIACLGDNIAEIMDILNNYEYKTYLIRENGRVTEATISNERAHYLFRKG